jgi:hypothetical protein
VSVSQHALELAALLLVALLVWLVTTEQRRH